MSRHIFTSARERRVSHPPPKKSHLKRLGIDTANVRLMSEQFRNAKTDQAT